MRCNTGEPKNGVLKAAAPLGVRSPGKRGRPRKVVPSSSEPISSSAVPATGGSTRDAPEKAATAKSGGGATRLVCASKAPETS